MAMQRRLIHSCDDTSAVDNLYQTGLTTLIQPVANRAYYMPFWLPDTFTVTHLYWQNGAGATGNADLGILDEAGVKLVSTGSQAKASPNEPQIFNVTDTTLPAGKYYWAYSTSTTAHMYALNISRVGDVASIGCRTENSAFALPATATFAVPADPLYPFVGATNGANILL